MPAQLSESLHQMPALLRPMALLAALILPTLAHAADLDRTRALLAEDNGRKWVASFVDAVAEPWTILPIDDADLLAQAAARHFNTDLIFEEVAATLAAALSPDDLDALLAWRDSDLGARIAAAETTYEPPDCHAPAATCGEALARMEIFEDPRLPAIRSVTARQNFARFDMTILMQMQRAIWTAGVAPPGEDPLTPDEIERALHYFAKDSAAVMARWHLSANADIYTPFSPEDISTYAAFLATDPAQIYLLAAGGALSHALSARAAKMGAELAAQGPTREL